MNREINLVRIRNDAEVYYRKGDYYCSEAVIAVLRNHIAPEMPIEAISMGSGFPVGIGGSGCTCGAISGGIVALGYFFGRTTPKDNRVNQAMALSKELHDSFRNNHKTLCCRSLTKGMELGSSVHMEQCIAFTGEIAYKTAQIVAREFNLQII